MKELINFNDLFDILEKLTSYLTSWRFISSLVIVGVAFLLLFLIRSLVSNIYKKVDNNPDDIKRLSFLKFGTKIIKLAVVSVAVLTILQIHGINVGSILAGLGIASAVAGLAVQDILKDVIMGVRIITDKFFNVGDIIRYGETEGVVEDFNVRVTRIRKLSNGDRMTICNRNISEISIVSNWSDIDLGLSYEEDPEKIHKLLGKIAKEIAKIEGVEDCVYKGTERFDSSSVIYKFRIYCPADRRFDIRRSAMRMIQSELNNHGITIPYNKLDVNIQGETQK